ncbi:hypothetical protein ACWDOP_27615 [Nocardia sp. NPDC003693]
MATKDVTVTVTMDEDEWRDLRAAAECAGMPLEAYIRWGVRLLAAPPRPGKNLGRGPLERRATRRRIADHADESEAAAWTETFAERLSHHSEQYR